LPRKPRLNIRARNFAAARESAYSEIMNAEGMAGFVEMARGNLGGCDVLGWAGGELNVKGERDIIAWAKVGLEI
jgi:hypothetical protein